MSRNYANIVTAIWGDPEWRALDERSQRLYLLLATQKNITAAGVLPITIGRWAGMAKDSTPESIRAGLRQLAADRFVAMDAEHEELLVRSFVRHDNGYNNKKRRMVIEAAAGEIESRTLRQVLAVEFVRLGLPADWTREDPVELPDEAFLGVAARVETAFPSVPNQPDSTPVDKVVENLFPQVDRPYRNPARPMPEEGTSDRVVVTEVEVVRTSTHNPQPSTPAIPAQRGTIVAPGWLNNGQEPGKKLIPSNTPHVGHQGGLFATTNVKITDREQVILTWLRENDYLDATHADAKAIDKLARKVWPGKNIGYLRGVAANTGFTNLYDQMRKERAKKVDDQIRHLERTTPACEHGTLAGLELHPTHGTMLCPQCRAGVPAEPEATTTPAAVSAALDAYRRHHNGHLSTFDLITITQQAAAFHAEGASQQQLETLAATAAKTGVGLISAASYRKDAQ
ncbi:hypothetical protein ABT336_13120 [Micromonospora sp. NPDC000207]|uniref:hypothetical protein n=1 Tax=Micromonospora sp. NPDC000207 TaxID=3154246 RepID=UPI0033195151